MHSRILSLLPDERNAGDTRRAVHLRTATPKDRLRCHKPSRWPSARTKEDQMNAFFDQADFGYVRQRMESMQPICSSNREWRLSECTDHLRFCRGRNILFDFKSLNAKRSKRYRDDVIHEGEVGGDCDSFDKELLRKRSDEKSYLQELFINGTFNDDVDIVWWETHSTGYQDRYFGATWKAFSKHAPHELISLDQKRVCFRNVMFPLLARQRFGLYYNMPLVGLCLRRI
ncbi:hypothetical protein QR680_019431 [Steinernema hermaphroditum]|uniref:Uncharacterized protein n=1 Tax=Steinernema hermaphroditum TaxID=289476 RepID=A0AA39GPI9_9BILA|nr:hypothetical protein QR680_019431 [Steinernema hermaphroditum]